VQVNSGGAGPVSAEWMVPKALWLKQNEPEVFAQATHICEYQVRQAGRHVAGAGGKQLEWGQRGGSDAAHSRLACHVRGAAPPLSRPPG